MSKHHEIYPVRALFSVPILQDDFLAKIGGISGVIGSFKARMDRATWY